MTWILGVNSTSMSLYIGGLLGTLDSAFCSVVEFVQTIRGNRPCRMNKCFKAEATNIEWEGVQSRSLPGLVRRQERVLHCGRCHATIEALCLDAQSHPHGGLVVPVQEPDDRLASRRAIFHGSFDYWRRFCVQVSTMARGDLASSTRVDPQPYFRIFDPLRQSERFESNRDGEYIRKWLPELRDYPGQSCNAIHERAQQSGEGRGRLRVRLQRKMGTPDRSWRMRRVRVGIGRWHGMVQLPRRLLSLDSSGVNST